MMIFNFNTPGLCPDPLGLCTSKGKKMDLALTFMLG